MRSDIHVVAQLCIPNPLASLNLAKMFEGKIKHMVALHETSWITRKYIVVMQSNCSKLWAGHNCSNHWQWLKSQWLPSRRWHCCYFAVYTYLNGFKSFPNFSLELLCKFVWNLNETVTCVVIWQYPVCVYVYCMCLHACAFNLCLWQHEYVQSPIPNMMYNSFCLLSLKKTVVHCGGVSVLRMTLLHGCHSLSQGHGIHAWGWFALMWCDAQCGAQCLQSCQERVVTSFSIHPSIHSSIYPFIVHSFIHSLISSFIQWLDMDAVHDKAWCSGEVSPHRPPSTVRVLVHHHAFHQPPHPHVVPCWSLSSHHCFPRHPFCLDSITTASPMSILTMWPSIHHVTVAHPVTGTPLVSLGACAPSRGCPSRISRRMNERAKRDCPHPFCSASNQRA